MRLKSGSARFGTNDNARRMLLVWTFSTIPDWTAVLKAARDGTDFGDDTVVATGGRWLATEDFGRIPAASPACL